MNRFVDSKLPFYIGLVAFLKTERMDYFVCSMLVAVILRLSYTFQLLTLLHLIEKHSNYQYKVSFLRLCLYSIHLQNQNLPYLHEFHHPYSKSMLQNIFVLIGRQMMELRNKLNKRTPLDPVNGLLILERLEKEILDMKEKLSFAGNKTSAAEPSSDVQLESTGTELRNLVRRH
jgi:hypothetical protein